LNTTSTVEEYGIYREGRQTRQQHRSFRFRGIVDHIPGTDGIAVSVYKKGLVNIVIDGYGTTSRLDNSQQDTLDFHDYMFHTQTGSDDDLRDALRNGEILIMSGMSDGSAKDNNGSAAWIITSELLTIVPAQYCY
jgi:hypothetical protein